MESLELWLSEGYMFSYLHSSHLLTSASIRFNLYKDAFGDTYHECVVVCLRLILSRHRKSLWRMFRPSEFETKSFSLRLHEKHQIPIREREYHNWDSCFKIVQFCCIVVFWILKNHPIQYSLDTVVLNVDIYIYISFHIKGNNFYIFKIKSVFKKRILNIVSISKSKNPLGRFACFHIKTGRKKIRHLEIKTIIRIIYFIEHQGITITGKTTRERRIISETPCYCLLLSNRPLLSTWCN